MAHAAPGEWSAAELQHASCCALLALLGARVRVTCEGGACLEGLLYSVDPETRTLLLLEARAGAGRALPPPLTLLRRTPLRARLRLADKARCTRPPCS